MAIIADQSSSRRGNSWFQYPILLNDVIDLLLEDLAIFSLDEGGDTLRNMIEVNEFINAMSSTNASIMLFSGGGNDLLAGGHLAEHLRDYDQKLSAEQHLLPSFDLVLGNAIGWYDKLFRQVENEAPGVVLIGHGYDRPVLANGRWLGGPMGKHNITDPDVQLAIAGVMIDRFNEELSRLAKGFSHVTILDIRGTLTKKSWYDELHPTDPGFAQIAALFKTAIEKVTVQPKDKAKPASGARAKGAKPGKRKPTQPQSPARVSGRKALSIHIGLNKVDPKHYEGWEGPLRSCEYDATDMQTIAKQQGFDTKVLLTTSATAAEVTKSISDAARQLKGGDILFVSYSGHGGTLPDFNGDEDDQQDETWCLYDRELVDDELYFLWRQFKPEVRLLIVSDSCHSGTVVRAANAETVKISLSPWPDARPRMMPDDVAGRVYRNNKEEYDKILFNLPALEPQFGRAVTHPLSCTVRLLSGCQDNQVSIDLPTNGAFTQSLLRVWNNGRFDGNYELFHENIRRGLPGTQVPNHWVVGQSNSVFDRQRPFTV